MPVLEHFVSIELTAPIFKFSDHGQFQFPAGTGRGQPQDRAVPRPGPNPLRRPLRRAQPRALEDPVGQLDVAPERAEAAEGDEIPDAVAERCAEVRGGGEQRCLGIGEGVGTVA
jgi:hypothetical protein